MAFDDLPEELETVVAEDGDAISEGGKLDLSTTTVSHFGYDGTQEYTSPVMNASDPGAADPANWLPGIVTGPTKTPGSFVCSAWVGRVIIDAGSDNIKAGTHQTCTVSFRTHWTNGQFAHNPDGAGWRRFTASASGPRKTGQLNDTTFRLRCRHRFHDDQHRLEARGYAIATAGVQVRGNLLYGRPDWMYCA